MPALGSAPEPGAYQPDIVSPNEQIDKGREYYENQRLNQALPQTPPAAAQPEVGESDEGEEQEGARSSAFSRLRRAAQQFRQQRAEEVTGPADAASKVAALNAMRALWASVHETLEDAALTFVDLMIITGPLAIGAYLLRLGAYLYGGIFTIRFKGVEIPLIPTFATGEVMVRTSKILIIVAVTAIVWIAIIFLIWILTNPVEAAKILTKELVNSICGNCLD